MAWYQRNYYTFDNDDRLFVEEITEASNGKGNDDGGTSGGTSVMECVQETVPDINKFDSDNDTTTDVNAIPTFEQVQATAIQKRNELRSITTLAINQLIHSKPARKISKWSVYSTITEIWGLVEALDERGIDECALKKTLKSVFDLTEPPLQFQSTGHEYIGRLIKHVFGGHGKNRVSIYIYV